MSSSFLSPSFLSLFSYFSFPSFAHRSLNAEAATMPSLGNQYFALGGSLPELSLTSLTRLLPNSNADMSNASQPSLFTLVHHPTPLYVYSSQQHLATPFINPHGSITFGSFLSTGSSLCNLTKRSSQEKETATEGEEDEDSAVKKEEKSGTMEGGLRLVTTGRDGVSGSNAATPELKMATTYSPITAHMIQPAPHGTLNRAVPLMTLPTFGTLTRNVGTLGAQAETAVSSPPHPRIIPHLSPYPSSVITSSPPGTSLHLTSSPHIVTAPPSLDHSTKASSKLSPSMTSSVAVGCSPMSPMQAPSSSSSIDSKMTILRTVGVPSPTELYLGNPGVNGIHTKMEGGGEAGSLTPTSADDQLLEQQGVKREKDKPYRCDHPGCERSFSFPAHLRSHIQQIHISYRPCKCEFPGCGKRFYTPQHLNVHRRVHTGERPFVCPYTDCCKAFTTAGNLKNHIRTHTGERPYACKFEGCTKRFAEMSSLKKHELTHTGEKPYTCRVCGKAFSQAGSRNTHERKHNRSEGEEVVNEGKVGRRYRIKRIAAASSPNSNHD